MVKAAVQLFASTFLLDVVKPLKSGKISKWPFPIHFNRLIIQVAILQKPQSFSLQALPPGLQDKQSS